MKATGIVRRIDDLGRVVVPKEIRRTMRIREGDPLEIFTDRNGEVIFKKYSPLGELSTFADDLCESIAKVTGFTCAICDKDAFISVFGTGKKDLLDASISSELEEIITTRKQVQSPIDALSNSDKYKVQGVSCIISNSEVAGSVLLVAEHDQEVKDSDLKGIEMASIFLSKHMN